MDVPHVTAAELVVAQSCTVVRAIFCALTAVEQLNPL